MSNVLRTILLSFLITIGIAGCKQQPSAEHLQLEKAEKQLAANLKMYASVWDEVINKGKLNQINETHFDKGITLVTRPENVIGIVDFKDHYKNYLVGFSNVNFTIVELFGQGDNIVKHWNFKGTHTGTFFGIPPSGKEVDIDGVTLVKMKAGKILREEDFMDNLEFFQQLGLLPRE